MRTFLRIFAYLLQTIISVCAQCVPESERIKNVNRVYIVMCTLPNPELSGFRPEPKQCRELRASPGLCEHNSRFYFCDVVACFIALFDNVVDLQRSTKS